MNEFEMMIGRNWMSFNFVVAFATFLAMAAIASRFRPTVLPTLLIALAGVPLSLIFGMIFVQLVIAAHHPRAMSAAISNPAGAFHYSLEWSVPLSVLYPLAVFALIYVQRRKRDQLRAGITASG